MLDAGAVLGMFPEGHRQRSGQLGEIQPGVSLFSLREGVVTIPVVLDGTERVVRNRLLRLPPGHGDLRPAARASRRRRAPFAARRSVVTERLVQAFHGSARVHGGGHVEPPWSSGSPRAPASAGASSAPSRLALKAAEEAPGPVQHPGAAHPQPGRHRRPGEARGGGHLRARRGPCRHGHPPVARRAAGGQGGAGRVRRSPSSTPPAPSSSRPRRRRPRCSEEGYFVIILGEKDHPEVLALRSYAGRGVAGGRVAGRPARGPAEPAGGRGRADHPVAGAPLGAGGSISRPACASCSCTTPSAAPPSSGRRRPWPWPTSVDAVVVVGGRNSGNTRRLAELCAARQPRTYHVESADELDPAWFRGPERRRRHRRRLHATRADRSRRRQTGRSSTS